MILAKHTTRRNVMAAMFGLGAAAIAGKGLAFAQDATGDDDDAKGRGHGMGNDGLHLGPDALPADVLAALDERIAAVQADRDAVAATADVTTVDAILSMAIDLRDQAGMIDAAADAEGFRATAGAAGMTVRAAHEALEAVVGGAGLPSMAERLTGHLPEIEDALADLANNVTASGNADAQALLDMANGVFAMAMDANDAGSYDVAGHLAHATGALGAAAAILIGEKPAGLGGRGGGMMGGGGGGRDGGRRGGGHDDADGDDAGDTDADDATSTPTV